jgi:HEAT repeat protein
MHRAFFGIVIATPVLWSVGCESSSSAPSPRVKLAAPRDADEEVRQAVKLFNSAEPLGRAQALASLWNVAEPQHATTCCLAALDDANYLVRLAAARLLGNSQNPAAVARLIELVSDRSEHDWVRSAAAESLGRTKATEATEPLITMLKDTVWNVRYQAAVALGRVGDPAAVEPLREAARYEPNQFVHDAMVASLRQLTGE